MIAVVDKELFDDATGLGFDFDLRERLNLSGGNDYLCQIATLDSGQFGGVNFMAGTKGSENAEASPNQN